MLNFIVFVVVVIIGMSILRAFGVDPTLAELLTIPALYLVAEAVANQVDPR